MDKIRVLFLCTGNSCRSQMAEGWARQLKGDVIDASSAGIEKHGMNMQAVEAMREAGVDISMQNSKTVDELPGMEFDYVITVCGHAHESCPLFPGKATVKHVGFDDPPRLAKTEGFDAFRRIRDEIRDFVESLPECLYETDTNQTAGDQG